MLPVLLLILALFITVKHKFKHSMVIKIQGLLLPVSAILLSIFLVVYSKQSVDAARTAVNMCINIIIPSLFPFFVLTWILLETGFTEKLGNLLSPVMIPLFRLPGCTSFALIMGMISGYPVGAKLTAELYNRNNINLDEAERLLACSNNSGPLFIVGAVGTGMLGNSNLGLVLLGTHIASSITLTFLLRFYPKRNKLKNSVIVKTKSHKSKRKIKVELFENAISDSVITLLSISGYIVFFAVLIEIFNTTGITSGISNLFKASYINSSVSYSISQGLIEITSGLKSLSELNNIGIEAKLIAAAFICGWAGISVHFQVAGFLKNTPIKTRLYLLGKVIHGLLASFYTFLFIKLYGIPVSVWSSQTPEVNIHSFKYLALPMLFILIFYIVNKTHKTIKNSSISVRHR